MTAADGCGQIDFTFAVSPADSYVILPQLKHYRNGASEKLLDEFTFVSAAAATQDGTVVTVSARFPDKGQYVLNIYGRNSDDDTKYKSAFRYLIRVNKTPDKCRPFPESSDLWTSDCTLFEPDFNRPIFAESNVRFRVRVPAACQAVVINSDDKANWMSLTTDGDGLWIGEAKSGKAGSQMELFAGYEEESGTVQRLLKFDVNKFLVIIFCIPCSV